MELFKFRGYISVGNVFPAKSQDINKKNEHYRWITELSVHTEYRFTMYTELS